MDVGYIGEHVFVIKGAKLQIIGDKIPEVLLCV